MRPRPRVPPFPSWFSLPDRSGPPVLTRRSLLASMSAAVMVAAAGCHPAGPTTVSMAGGEPEGFFGQFADLFAQAVAREGGRFRIDPQVTYGTLENLGLLTDNEVDLALALADAAAEEQEGLVGIGRIYETYWQVLVRSDSKLGEVADLAGQVVSLGAQGSGTRFTALRIVEQAGLTAADIVEHPIPLVEVGQAVADGTLDAAVFAGGLPIPVVAEQGVNTVRLIGIPQEVAGLRERYGSVYRQVRIPAGIYGTPTDTPSLGVASLLMARPDLPDSTVAALTHVLVTRSADLVPEETLGTQYLDPRSLINTGGIPLHPAAAKTYRRIHG